MSDAARATALPAPGTAVATGGAGLSEGELTVLSVLGHVMIDHRQFGEACAVFEALVELHPENGYARRMLVYARLEGGEAEPALAAAAEYRRLGSDDGLGNAAVTLLESKALWALGRGSEARERLNDYLDMAVTL